MRVDTLSAISLLETVKRKAKRAKNLKEVQQKEQQITNVYACVCVVGMYMHTYICTYMSTYFVARQFVFVFSPYNYVIGARNFMLKMLQVLQLLS